MKIIGIIIVIWIVWAIIATIVKNEEQAIRDRAARKILGSSFDYQKEKADILAINSKFGFSRKEVKKTPLAVLAAKYRKKTDRDVWNDFVNSLKKE